MVKRPKKRSRRRVVVVLGACIALVCVCLGVIVGGWLLIGEGGRSPLRSLQPHQSARLGEPFTLEDRPVDIADEALTVEVESVIHGHLEDGRGFVVVRLLVTRDHVTEQVALEPGEERVVGGYRIQMLSATFAGPASRCEVLITKLTII
jgi:hypothetical protein